MAIKINIPKPDMFSFQECLWFLNRNYDDCLFEMREKSVRKLISLEGEFVLFEVKETEAYLVCEILNDAVITIETLAAYVIDWFDLDRVINSFYQLLKKDKDLAHFAKKYHGLRLIAISDLFEALCWSIIGQQVNLTFAYKCKRALVEKYGQKLIFERKIYYLFPNPEKLACLEVHDLKKLQFSRQKAEYIIGIAQLLCKKQISKKALLALPSEQAIAKELMKIRGVGAWTANYVMMKCLKCPNALTYGDVGLYNALHTVKGFPKRPTKEVLDIFFDDFKNWKAYLVLYLWRSLSEPNDVEKMGL